MEALLSQFWDAWVLSTLRRFGVGSCPLDERRRREKEAFLEFARERQGLRGGKDAAASPYGYDGSIDAMRREEFSRLEGSVYLDHAGATLYSERQLGKCLEELGGGVYSNPHSEGTGQGPAGVSGARAASLQSERRAVLAMFNASPEDYLCIFTAGATAGLKAVGETFRWDQGSTFMYTSDNHNSVLGIRNYALERGASAVAASRVTVDARDGCFDLRTLSEQRRVTSGGGGASSSNDGGGGSPCLFAFPAESNFSGVRYNLDLVKDMKAKRCRVDGASFEGDGREWYVLLDAAKACCTRPPDLSQFPADFVVVSFYKIFGYPCGLGALLVRRDACRALKRTYFGGGTVNISIAEEDFTQRRSEEDGWENGTLPFLSLRSLKHGFDQIGRLSFGRIEAHTRALTEYTAHRMSAMRHHNGAKVCELYGRHSFSEVEARSPQAQRTFEVGQGPIIAFNVVRSEGTYLGYRELETLSESCGFVLRTGCHCNPGACSTHLGLTPDEAKANFESGHVCWDDKDVINGKPTGCARISFGYMSTFEDAHAFLTFLEKTCVATAPPQAREKGNREISKSTESGATRSTDLPLVLKEVFVYPIKSCQGFAVASWPIAGGSLYLDRHWAIADEDGLILSQKREARLAQVETRVDLLAAGAATLHLAAPGMPRFESRLAADGDVADGEGVARWLAALLGKKCRLVCCNEVGRGEKNFSNQGGYLLVSMESVRAVGGGGGGKSESLIDSCLQFRPNFVVEGGKPFEEQRWGRVAVGERRFEKREDCTRCGMVTIDQRTGERKHANLLKAISKTAPKSGLKFGILLNGAEVSDEPETGSVTISSGLPLAVDYRR